MKAIRCTGCGANITIDDSKEFGVCEYCGTKYQNEKKENNTIINNTTINYITNEKYEPPINKFDYRIEADSHSTVNFDYGDEKNKYISLILCIFLGGFGAHKFYEGKTGMGILYLCTAGLFGIGILIDIIVLLTKPNPYYV